METVIGGVDIVSMVRAFALCIEHVFAYAGVNGVGVELILNPIDGGFSGFEMRLRPLARLTLPMPGHVAPPHANAVAVVLAIAGFFQVAVSYHAVIRGEGAGAWSPDPMRRTCIVEERTVEPSDIGVDEFVVSESHGLPHQFAYAARPRFSSAGKLTRVAGLVEFEPALQAAVDGFDTDLHAGIVRVPRGHSVRGL